MCEIVNDIDYSISGKKIEVVIISTGKNNYSFGSVKYNNSTFDVFINHNTFKDNLELSLGDKVKGTAMIPSGGKHANKVQLINCNKVKKGFFSWKK